MTLIAGLELVVIALLAFLLYRTVREDRAERRQLLDRIQRPDLLPRDKPMEFAPVEPEPDETHLVGRVLFPVDDAS